MIAKIACLIDGKDYRFDYDISEQIYHKISKRIERGSGLSSMLNSVSDHETISIDSERFQIADRIGDIARNIILEHLNSNDTLDGYKITKNHQYNK